MNLLSKEIFVVALGGSVGSVARLLLSRWVQIIIPFEQLPWGIIAVNIIGCFFIGLVYGVFELKLLLNPLWRTGLVIGILGGFTTFSSFAIDTVVFLQKGAYMTAISNIFLSVVLCLFATLVGMWTIMMFIAR